MDGIYYLRSMKCVVQINFEYQLLLEQCECARFLMFFSFFGYLFQSYCVLLSKQLSQHGLVKGTIGKSLEPSSLDDFSNEQLQQLLALKIETAKQKV